MMVIYLKDYPPNNMNPSNTGLQVYLPPKFGKFSGILVVRGMADDPVMLKEKGRL
jgi:hypothetical protein